MYLARKRLYILSMKYIHCDFPTDRGRGNEERERDKQAVGVDSTLRGKGLMLQACIQPLTITPSPSVILCLASQACQLRTVEPGTPYNLTFLTSHKSDMYSFTATSSEGS